jgi:NADPH:quinone reductase-like Zn-dependent oxidoreductase
LSSNPAVAINAVDAYKQLLGDAFLPYMKLPCVPGNNLAGEVEVGSAITRFHAGDRVCAKATGTAEFGNRQAEGASQEYVVVREHLTARIPDDVTYEQAAVIPLAFSIAAYGLFHKSTLGLQMPHIQTDWQALELLVTSGASSVGSNAIQLARAAGYIFFTISPNNFELLYRLAAEEAVDYHSQNAAKKLATVQCDGMRLEGALAINPGGVAQAGELLNIFGNSVKVIADAGPPPPGGVRTG